MLAQETARLTRRLDEQDGTIRAVSDTVIDIKETVDQHTEILAAIQETQVQQGALLAHQGALLAQHGELLAQHGELLAEILRRLASSTTG
jgi:hypothetical protein